jgi:hypothetical protein
VTKRSAPTILLGDAANLPCSLGSGLSIPPAVPSAVGLSCPPQRCTQRPSVGRSVGRRPTLDLSTTPPERQPSHPPAPTRPSLRLRSRTSCPSSLPAFPSLPLHFPPSPTHPLIPYIPIPHPYFLTSITSRVSLSSPPCSTHSLPSSPSLHRFPHSPSTSLSPSSRRLTSKAPPDKPSDTIHAVLSTPNENSIWPHKSRPIASPSTTLRDKREPFRPSPSSTFAQCHSPINLETIQRELSASLTE